MPRTPRLYLERTLHLHMPLILEGLESHRLSTVLRLEKDHTVSLFNGDGFEYLATITMVNRRAIHLKITEKIEINLESPLFIHLGQVISKGEKMDFVVQKATELGVQAITPLLSERCVVHVKTDRLEKKQEHWKKIAIHAAEQCGRVSIPIIHSPIPLMEWVFNTTEMHRLVLSLNAKQRLKKIPLSNSVAVLTGPEGGLTEAEIDFAVTQHFIPITLGPRVLRTETAALTILSLLQYQAGDLS
jgi:16S rRNA (uracil1498-N3)-methyltransferase